MSHSDLINAVIQNSTANDWETAKLEWEFKQIYQEPDRSCLCGHTPITNICVIRNNTNMAELEIGNECVKQFSIDLAFIGESLIKLNKDLSVNTPKKLAEYAFKKKVINKWELDFCLDRTRKRNASLKQVQTRNNINKKINSFFYGESCPQCNSGKLIEKSSQYSKFFGCSSYPICTYKQ